MTSDIKNPGLEAGQEAELDKHTRTIIVLPHDHCYAAWWFRPLQKLSEEVKGRYGIELRLDNIKSLPPHMTEYMFSGIISVSCDKQFEYVCRLAMTSEWP
ncbi:hypothetical protein EB796_002512 [Bugula neritina]|uniref:Uncharacterized protein n=1 Tax=Bugula neritina TaxID=10212 RepID=A0A7J7KLY9_BUGNE|nr:hypothetical protein EB796_002512 [Bugula neritina]